MGPSKRRLGGCSPLWPPVGPQAGHDWHVRSCHRRLHLLHQEEQMRWTRGLSQANNQCQLTDITNQAFQRLCKINFRLPKSIIMIIFISSELVCLYLYGTAQGHGSIPSSCATCLLLDCVLRPLNNKAGFYVNALKYIWIFF